jgi:hypothetical protein
MKSEADFMRAPGTATLLAGRVKRVQETGEALVKGG